MSILGIIRRHRDARKMSCAEVGEVLQQYLDGEYDSDRAPLVRAHLEVCKRCGLEASVYTDIKEALAHQVEPPVESRDRLREFGERIAHGDIPAEGG
ncbi:MAG: zf-HC2 domain-containing protein [Microthrixaceae bacterium]